MAVQIGLKGLVYALQLTDVLGATATYGPVTKVAGAITATINPNASLDTLFADDGPMETATTLGKIDFDLVVADLDFKTQAALLGHTIVAGVLTRKAGDTPPWTAVGFQTIKSNGKYRFVWLLKGKFSVPEMKNETKTDKIAWGNPSIKGAFAKRDCDDAWIIQADEDDEEFLDAATFLTEAPAYPLVP